jgi:hypothetical protein
MDDSSNTGKSDRGAFGETSRIGRVDANTLGGEGRSSDGMQCMLPSYRRARGTDKKETGNEEGSTAVAKQKRNFSQQKLTIGLDLGDRNSWHCVMDEAGHIQLEQRVRTTAKSLARSVWRYAAEPDRAGNRDTFALDQSLAHRVGQEVIVANARKGAADRGSDNFQIVRLGSNLRRTSF